MNAAVAEPLQHARVARARVVGSASARSMPVLGLVTVKIVIAELAEALNCRWHFSREQH